MAYPDDLQEEEAGNGVAALREEARWAGLLVKTILLLLKLLDH